VNIVAPPHIFQRLHFHKATREQREATQKCLCFYVRAAAFPTHAEGKETKEGGRKREKERNPKTHTHELTHFLIAPRVQQFQHLYIFLFRAIRRAEEGRDYRIRSQSWVGAHFFNDCGACVPLDWFNNA